MMKANSFKKAVLGLAAIILMNNLNLGNIGTLTVQAEELPMTTVSGGDAAAVATEAPEVLQNGSSLEDLLGEVDNTDDVVEEVVELTFNIPENVIISKDGIALCAVEETTGVLDGTIVLSQPTELPYKNRIQSDVLVHIANGTVVCEWAGNQVDGTATDALGNSVSFDGKVLTILNSDKMEDVVPEEDDDQPEEPEELPGAYTVRYWMNSVEEGNLLGSYEFTGVIGAEIAVDAIDLNLHKPTDTDALVWSNGSMVTVATIITEDDTDVIDIVYISEEVVVYGDYTVNYYIDSVEEMNLLATYNNAGIVGAAIDLAAVELNLHKPIDTEALVWADGIMLDGAATTIVEDDTDIINILYTSTPVVVVGEADYVVKYYKDALKAGNFLGEVAVNGNAGEAINYGNIDVNVFQPESYSDGEIQDVVSAFVVTEDDSDIVYVLYTEIKLETKVVTQTIEVPGETVYVPVPGEKEYIEVPGPTQYIEVPGPTQYIEVPGPTQYVNVPGEKEYIYVNVPGEKEYVYVNVPGETVYLPGEKEIVYVDRIVEKEVEKIVYVPVEDDTPDQLPDPEFDEDEPEMPEDGPQTGDETPLLLLFMVMVSLFIYSFKSKKA